MRRTYVPRDDTYSHDVKILVIKIQLTIVPEQNAEILITLFAWSQRALVYGALGTVT